MSLKSRQVSQQYYAISLATFKQWLKWDPDDSSEDDVMNACLYGAVDWAQSYTRRTLFVSVWQTFLESFSCTKFDKLPIDLTTLTIQYYDVNDAIQTLSNTLYDVLDNGSDDYAEIIFSGSLPSLYDRYEPIVIQYTAGYTVLPERLQVEIFKYAASDFENRTTAVSGSMNLTPISHQAGLFPWKML